MFESGFNIRDFSRVSVSCFIADVGDDFVHDKFVDVRMEGDRVWCGVDKVAEGKIESTGADPEVMKVNMDLVFLVGDVDAIKS